MWGSDETREQMGWRGRNYRALWALEEPEEGKPGGGKEDVPGKPTGEPMCSGMCARSYQIQECGSKYASGNVPSSCF